MSTPTTLARGPHDVYVCVFLHEGDGVCVGGGGDEGVTPACEDVLNTLPGFLVAMTSEGKLLYVSENVSHYLGLSMVSDIIMLYSSRCGHVICDIMWRRFIKSMFVMVRWTFCRETHFTA